MDSDYSPIKNCQKCCAAFDPLLGQHICYIQPPWFLDKQSKNDKIRYVFYDIETTQNEKMDILGLPVSELPPKNAIKIEIQYHKHNAILLVAEVICKNCIDEGIDPGVHYDRKSAQCCCGVFDRKFAFRSNLVDQKNRRLLQFNDFCEEVFDDVDMEDGSSGKNPSLDGFLEFLLVSGSRMTTTYAIAHNAGKFDLHILLERIYAHQLIPKITLTGMKHIRANGIFS